MKILKKYLFFNCLLAVLMCSGCRSFSGISVQKIGFSDLHNSVISRMFYQKDSAGLEAEKFSVSRSGIRKANGKLLVLSLGITRFDMKNPDTPDITEAIQFLKNFRNYAEKNYPNFVFAENSAHLRKLIKERKTAYVFGLEGTHLLEDKIQYLDSLYAVGVRKITFGHRFHNQFISKPKNRKKRHVKGFPDLLDDNSVISDEGKKLLEKMIAKKMIIGVSHLGKTAFDEILEINQGRTKIVAGHSNTKSVCYSARNLTDDQIIKIAKNKGLIGICLHQPMISKNKQKTDLEQVIKHILHIRNLVGAEFIAFGTDFEGRIHPVKGAEKLDENLIQNLISEMQKQGLSKQEIQQILSQNVVDFY